MSFVAVKDVLRYARQTYQQADKLVADKAKQLKATCTKGCSACCYQLVSVSFIEALVVADYLVRNRTLDEIALLKEELKIQSDRLRFERNRLTLFEARVPCAFLKLSAPYVGECTVYGSRPLACRLQYVVSDPKHCSPDSPDPNVGLVDVSKLHVSALRAITGGSPQLAGHGPLAPMVLLAIEAAETGEHPSPLQLEYWHRRTEAMLNYSRAQMEIHGIKETYVK
jgi:Fe-S-cluster containining protein